MVDSFVKNMHSYTKCCYLEVQVRHGDFRNIFQDVKSKAEKQNADKEIKIYVFKFV